MGKMLQQPDGTWQTIRNIDGRMTTIYIRDLGHGFFAATVFGRDGVEIVDSMGYTKKEAIDKAARIAKRKMVAQRTAKAPAMPTEDDFLAALGPCNK